MTDQSKACQALIAALTDAGLDLPDTTGPWSIRRINAGYIQRQCGAWSWALDYAGSDALARGYSGTVGSQWPAKRCASAGVTLSNSHGDIAAYPKDLDQ